MYRRQCVLSQWRGPTLVAKRDPATVAQPNPLQLYSVHSPFSPLFLTSADTILSNEPRVTVERVSHPPDTLHGAGEFAQISQAIKDDSFDTVDLALHALWGLAYRSEAGVSQPGIIL